MYFVYILKCSDNRLYVGCTKNVDERLARHNNKSIPATSNRTPVQLVSFVMFLDKYKAFNFEKYLKSGSGRAFLSKHLI